jgi:hypothetical protein
VGVGGALGAAALLLRGAWARRRLRDHAPWLVLALFTASYLGPLLVRLPFFDRWLLPAVPPLAVLLLASLPGRPRAHPGALRWTAALLLGLPLAVYGVAGTRDYMEHHRARWSLLDALAARGVSPERVDGGFEYNGWFNFDRDPTRFLGGVSRWVVDDAFVVSLAPEMPGYVQVDVRSFRRWLPAGTEHLYLFRRRDAAPGAAEPSASPSAQGEAGREGPDEQRGQHRAPDGAAERAVHALPQAHGSGREDLAIARRGELAR